MAHQHKWHSGVRIAIAAGLLGALAVGGWVYLGGGPRKPLRAAVIYEFMPYAELRQALDVQYSAGNHLHAVELLLSNIAQTKFSREPEADQQAQLIEFARIHFNYLSEAERAEVEGAWLEALPANAYGHWVRAQMLHSMKLGPLALGELDAALAADPPAYFRDALLEGRVIAALATDPPDPATVARALEDIPASSGSRDALYRNLYRVCAPPAPPKPSTEMADALEYPARREQSVELAKAVRAFLTGECAAAFDADPVIAAFPEVAAATQGTVPFGPAAMLAMLRSKKSQAPEKVDVELSTRLAALLTASPDAPAGAAAIDLLTALAGRRENAETVTLAIADARAAIASNSEADASFEPKLLAAEAVAAFARGDRPGAALLYQEAARSARESGPRLALDNGDWEADTIELELTAFRCRLAADDLEGAVEILERWEAHYPHWRGGPAMRASARGLARMISVKLVRRDESKRPVLDRVEAIAQGVSDSSWLGLAPTECRSLLVRSTSSGLCACLEGEVHLEALAQLLLQQVPAAIASPGPPSGPSREQMENDLALRLTQGMQSGAKPDAGLARKLFDLANAYPTDQPGQNTGAAFGLVLLRELSPDGLNDLLADGLPAPRNFKALAYNAATCLAAAAKAREQGDAAQSAELVTRAQQWYRDFLVKGCVYAGEGDSVMEDPGATGDAIAGYLLTAAAQGTEQQAYAEVVALFRLNEEVPLPFLGKKMAEFLYCHYLDAALRELRAEEPRRASRLLALCGQVCAAMQGRFPEDQTIVHDARCAQAAADRLTSVAYWME